MSERKVLEIFCGPDVDYNIHLKVEILLAVSDQYSAKNKVIKEKCKLTVKSWSLKAEIVVADVYQ